MKKAMESKKKFKNTDWSMEGSVLQLTDMRNNLYEEDMFISHWDGHNKLVWDGYYLTSEPGCGDITAVFMVKEKKEKHFTLPDQFKQAFEYATELEEPVEETPGYVECEKGAYPIKEGEICKVDSYGVIQSPRYKDSHVKFNLKIHSTWFKPSTKEAYLAQFGVKVGDELDIEVIRKWDDETKCYYNGRWTDVIGKFTGGNRKVESIDILDNKPAFLLSGTNSVWMQLEGFKAFEKEQMKPVEESAPEKPQHDLEVGKWYKMPYNQSMFYVTRIDTDDNAYGYGFNNDGEWVERLETNGVTCICNQYAAKNAELATYEEVRAALIKEAKRRGLVEGAKARCLANNEVYVINGPYTYYYNIHDLWAEATKENVCIFKFGKWAEVISEPHPEAPATFETDQWYKHKHTGGKFLVTWIGKYAVHGYGVENGRWNDSWKEAKLSRPDYDECGKPDLNKELIKQ